MGASPEIFLERDPWQKPLTWSLVLHGGLAVGILAYSAISGGFGGSTWGGGGGGGGAMSARLVSSASIPLPAPEVQSQNVLATENKGVSQSLPKQQEKAPEAVPIPDRNAKQKPPKPTRTTVAKQTPVEPEPGNVAPYGEGGQPSAHYSMYNVGDGKGGFSFSGGGGDFGSRYGWYVSVVQRKVSENWYKYEVDPGSSAGRRVYIVFDILRDGRPANVQVEQSSGVPSMDISAVRALQRIDTFGTLPGDYSGNKVSVEFWFEK
jgi:protein TonB